MSKEGINSTANPNDQPWMDQCEDPNEEWD